MGVVVIDPGPADPGHLANIRKVVAARGTAAMVLLTHHHVDHSEAALEVAQALGASLAGLGHTEGPDVQRRLAGGEVIELGAVTLDVLATPGHTRDHACFNWREANAVFAGDLVAGEGFIVIDPPEGNMSDYLQSLARVRDLPGSAGRGPSALLPGHGPEIDNPRRYLDGYIAHRLQREEKVRLAVPVEEGLGAQALLPLAYDDTPEFMYPVAARSLQAHLDKLLSDGRLIEHDGVYRRPA
jgi:glyoxylase-like metal-dependent hydrolase (beta-lactamase superfamily II)